MCGIYGYIGSRDSTKECLLGLQKLEYRGYDSAGIAGIKNGKLFLRKEKGRLAALVSTLDAAPLPLDVAISHTRWATHGEPSKANAHPHFDSSETIAVVHNGILENHAHLRKMLQEKGVIFQSETDTEVIAQLLAFNYKGNMIEAIQASTEMMKGFWGLAIVHRDMPDKIYTVARENPLAIGLCTLTKEAIISSDPNAFPTKDLDVFYLHDNEIAVVTRDGVEVFDKAAQRVNKESERLGERQDAAELGDYDHFMQKEIFEQPSTIRLACHGRFLEDFGTAILDDLRLSSQELLSIHRIVIVACGTSWHAGCIAASLLEDKARIPTTAEIASEFRYKNPIIDEQTLVIAISQSGETLDTIAAVREVKTKGAKVIGICNVPNSTLTREADSCIFLRAGPEISVCSTKAFTSQISVLSIFTLLMARLRHMSKEEGIAFIEEMRKLPDIVSQVLDKAPQIEAVAKEHAKFENFFFLGRHYMFATCLESALKLKEISYLNALGLPAGEMKHGPIALIDEKLLTIALCGNSKTLEKTASNLMEVKARGGPLLAFAPEGALPDLADWLIELPRVSDELATIPYSVATQLYAYYLAKELGTDIDKPRNLAKSVTVE